MAERAERGDLGARAAMERYGWNAREVAQRFGVSERTARRWRQQDRIPERRREDFQREQRRERQARQRARMERRGVGSLSAQGEYQVSKSRYRTRRQFPVKTLDGNRISAATMRQYFAALDRGDADRADQLLNEALGAGYGMFGGSEVRFTDADSVDFTI
jgi:hypothetical protein